MLDFAPGPARGPIRGNDHAAAHSHLYCLCLNRLSASRRCFWPVLLWQDVDGIARADLRLGCMGYVAAIMLFVFNGAAVCRGAICHHHHGYGAKMTAPRAVCASRVFHRRIRVESEACQTRAQTPPVIGRLGQRERAGRPNAPSRHAIVATNNQIKVAGPQRAVRPEVSREPEFSGGRQVTGPKSCQSQLPFICLSATGKVGLHAKSSTRHLSQIGLGGAAGASPHSGRSLFGPVYCAAPVTRNNPRPGLDQIDPQPRPNRRKRPAPNARSGSHTARHRRAACTMPRFTRYNASNRSEDRGVFPR